MSRLSERRAVVTGLMSAKMYKEDPENWDVERDDIQKLFKKHWAQSMTVAAFVGEAKELKPLIEKRFPGYSIVVIPYKKTILEETYR
jgi:hypothetical protein